MARSNIYAINELQYQSIDTQEFASLYDNESRPSIRNVILTKSEFIVVTDETETPSVIDDFVNNYLLGLTPIVTNLFLIGIVEQAIDFGNDLLKQFGAENISLGIIQSGKLRDVRIAMQDVSDCLRNGALTDALVAVREIPDESKDEVFLSNARLLSYVNKVESYLGLPLSEEL